MQLVTHQLAGLFPRVAHRPAVTSPGRGHRAAFAWRSGPGQWAPLGALVFVVAVACRIAVLEHDHGLKGNSGYDASVYFAAADALTHGRLPYRDFTLLHPPGMMLALSPFGWLTRLVPDPTAFMVTNLAITLVGAACAVLVVQICRRLGLGRGPALVGGLFYATWFGAVGAEYHAKLEPVGNLLLLSAVLVALGGQRNDRPWRSRAAGVLLGLALTVKIWWIVPVLGVLLWHGLTTRAARPAARMAAGAAGAAVLVCLPFFVLAPRRMWQSVILDQLGRGRMRGPLTRVADLSTLTRLGGQVPSGALLAGCVVAALLLVVAAVGAWRCRLGRPAVILLAAQLVVLFAAPSWFPFYADYVAGALSITVAAGAAWPVLRGRRLPRGVVAWLPTGAAAAVTVLVLATRPAAAPPAPGLARLSEAVAGTRCVMSDSPMGLIEVDALSRGLAHGCPNWVDVTGRTYGPDKVPGRSRPVNPRWQADLRTYLRSGGAVLIVRRGGTGIAPRTQAAISHNGVLARADGRTIYRVTHRSAPGGDVEPRRAVLGLGRARPDVDPR